jgi:CDGSH-type Zn-finger protein
LVYIHKKIGNIGMKERTIKYIGKDINIYFTVDRCTHVAECVRGAPDVFDPTRCPWVVADAAEPDKVAEVILCCPTGALHFKRKDGGTEETIPTKNRATICRNGPLYLHGNLEIHNSDGSFILKDTRLALCRCGESRIMPLCDRNHLHTRFTDGKKFSTGKIQKNQDCRGIIITLKKDGPLHIQGPLEILNPEGEICFEGTSITLCRCGRSQKMPFCDGSHVKTGFKTKKDVTLIQKEERITNY